MVVCRFNLYEYLTPGNPLKVNKRTNSDLHAGSLLDLLPGSDGKPVRGLSIVNIPMGGSNVPKPPLHR
jgi:hypothetical protein